MDVFRHYWPHSPVLGLAFVCALLGLWSSGRLSVLLVIVFLISVLLSRKGLFYVGFPQSFFLLVFSPFY